MSPLDFKSSGGRVPPAVGSIPICSRQYCNHAASEVSGAASFFLFRKPERRWSLSSPAPYAEHGAQVGSAPLSIWARRWPNPPPRRVSGQHAALWPACGPTPLLLEYVRQAQERTSPEVGSECGQPLKMPAHAHRAEQRLGLPPVGQLFLPLCDPREEGVTLRELRLGTQTREPLRCVRQALTGVQNSAGMCRQDALYLDAQGEAIEISVFPRHRLGPSCGTRSGR